MAPNRIVSTQQEDVSLTDRMQSMTPSRTIVTFVWQHAVLKLRNRSKAYRLQWVQDTLVQRIASQEKYQGVLRKAEVLGQLVDYVVQHVGENIHFARMARSLGLDVRIVRSYMQVLKERGTIVEIPAWTRRPFTRMAKASKWVVQDLRFVCALSKGKDAKDYMARLQEAGPRAWQQGMRQLLLPLVTQRLQRLMQGNSGWSMYHLCASDRYAVDFLLENAKGDWMAIDVLATSRPEARTLKNIVWAQDYFTQHKTHSFLLYMGEATRRLAKNRYAVPILSLWDEAFFRVASNQ